MLDDRKGKVSREAISEVASLETISSKTIQGALIHLPPTREDPTVAASDSVVEFLEQPTTSTPLTSLVSTPLKSLTTGPFICSRPIVNMDARKGSLATPLFYLEGRDRVDGQYRTSESRNVTLHAVDKFAPIGAVTAPKVTELHRSVTSLGCIPL